MADSVREYLASRIPMGRLAKAEEVAATVLFLLGDQSSLIIGKDIRVDGDLTQLQYILLAIRRQNHIDYT